MLPVHKRIPGEAWGREEKILFYFGNKSRGDSGMKHLKPLEISRSQGLHRRHFGSTTFPFSEPGMASEGKGGDEAGVGGEEEDQGRSVLRGGPCPPRTLHRPAQEVGPLLLPGT